MNKKIILIDMDGTIANFNKSILQKMDKKYNILLSNGEITHFRIEKNFEKTHREEITEWIEEKNFYLELEPFENSIKYIKEIFSHQDFDVFFCTSPLLSTYCIPEKQEWIKKYFGEEYLSKIIFSKDKTVVFGDILIDDKPSIHGVNKTPSWEHVYFNQTYNEENSGRRIVNWKDWRKILLD